VGSYHTIITQLACPNEVSIRVEFAHKDSLQRGEVKNIRGVGAWTGIEIHRASENSGRVDITGTVDGNPIT
jgi:hypothetical protein